MLLEDKRLLTSSKYAKEIGTNIGDSARPETVTYLLKNQLAEAAILNHNLKRVVSLLIWKLNAERASASVKGEMGRSLQNTVDALELLLKQSTAQRNDWKRRFDKLDYEIAQLHQYLALTLSRPKVSTTGSFCGGKPRILRRFSKRILCRQATHTLAEGGGVLPCPSPGFLSPNRDQALEFSAAFESQGKLVL